MILLAGESTLHATEKELLSGGKYTEAVLDFVRKTKVGEAKNGIIRPRH